MYPQSMFLAKIRKTITFFHLKIIDFTAVKYFSILHGHVCVMMQVSFHNHRKNVQSTLHITQTRPCNIQQYFTAVKNVNFQMKNYNISLVLL